MEGGIPSGTLLGYDGGESCSWKDKCLFRGKVMKCSGKKEQEKANETGTERRYFELSIIRKVEKGESSCGR